MPAAGPVEQVLALHAIGEPDAGRVGAKAARLGALVRAGLPVPEGLVLTTAAYRSVLAAAGLGPDAPVDRILAAALPADVADAVSSVGEYFGEATLAVRSSAVGEDGADRSYAGQFTTVLNVRGPEALRGAVRACWASAHSDLVRGYHGTRSTAPDIAVLVQRQVDADAAGVAFTADPVTGARDVVLVSAVPGLGDGLVSGRVEPDEWSVSGTVATPLRMVHHALTAAQATAVGALALRIEQVFGGPQDVEWALAAGRLVALQARPVTALPRVPEVQIPPGTWVKEDERHPEPMTELGASGVGAFVSRGLTRMSRESGGLVDRFDSLAIGGEPYVRVVPIGGRGGPPPPWWLLGLLARVVPPMRRQMRRAKQLLAPGGLDGFQTRWEQEWRPQLQERIERLRAVELAGLDDAGLSAHVDGAVATLDHALSVHFRLTVPYLVPVHDLLLAGRRLGWPDAKTIELVAGTSAATSAPSAALDELAAAVAESPAAVAVLDEPGADLTERLAGVDPALGAALDEWCARYGACCVNDDPGSPTLAELPGALAALLRDAVSAARQDTPDRLARVRAERAAEARALLAGRGSAERDGFEWALAAALRAYPLREDSAFWTGSLPAGLVRRAALEVGRRLVARGALDRADDVVNLDLDTLRTAAADPDGAAAAVRSTVARVRAERAWVRAHPGPAYYGPPPQRLPDVRGLPAAGRRVNAALLYMQQRGTTAPGPGPSDEALLRGVPGSPGRHTGPVRVIRGAADFHRVRAGDVLVCPTTDPAWSLLFGVAGALVTDGGNVLSHAAIVAREHAIPAVVGTRRATRTLHDGQLVVVDGTSGVITAAQP